MALRIYASGNMVAIENTKTGVIKKRAKNLIAYNIDSSASPVLYNLYIKDPFGAIEEGLNIDGFQKENGDPYATDTELQDDLDGVLGSPG